MHLYPVKFSYRDIVALPCSSSFGVHISCFPNVFLYTLGSSATINSAVSPYYSMCIVPSICACKNAAGMLLLQPICLLMRQSHTKA